MPENIKRTWFQWFLAKCGQAQPPAAVEPVQPAPPVPVARAVLSTDVTQQVIARLGDYIGRTNVPRNDAEWEQLRRIIQHDLQQIVPDAVVESCSYKTPERLHVKIIVPLPPSIDNVDLSFTA